jgi:hypothetical protein
MLALRTASIIALVAVLAVCYLAFRACPEPAAAPLPGAVVFQAAERLGWQVRADPFAPFGEGFHLSRAEATPPPLDHWMRFGWRGPGLLRVRKVRILPDAQPQQDDSVVRVGGWAIDGDPAMVEALTRELERP